MTILVTGASRGIGAAVAVRLAAPGTTVALIARTESGLARTAERVADAGARPVIIRLDVTDVPAVEEALTQLRAEHGPVEVFVSNAGANPYFESALRTTPEHWDEVMGVNLRSAFFANTAVARAMIADGVPGSIINIASVGADRPVPNTLTYCTAKAAVVHLIKGLALELAQHRIRVNGVAPGYVNTELTARLRDRPELFREMVSAIPLGRLAEVEDVAECVAYLAGSSYVTGSVVTVDGGYRGTWGWPRARSYASGETLGPPGNPPVSGLRK